MEPKPTILLVGKDTALNYLFSRFAEQGGYSLVDHTDNLPVEQIETVKPTVVLFLTTELLAKHQVLVTELANRDLPVLVCSSTAEESHARELGADYCLFHPLTYHDFQATLVTILTSKHA
jgi:CheY-like chemotaxis protein